MRPIELPLRVPLAVFLLWGMAGCDGTGPSNPSSPGPVALVTLSPAAGRVLPGEQLQLVATPRDRFRNPLSDRPVTWSSSDESRAVVSAEGLVSAVSAGPITITASSETVSATAELIVEEGGVVGPAGGSVTALEGSVMLTVPENALGAPTAIHVNPLPNPPLDATAVGSGFHIRTATDFAVPATLTLSYDPSAGPAGVPDSRLGIRTLVGNGWRAVPGGAADPASRTASVLLTTGGSYGVGRLPPETPCTAPEHRQFDFWLGQWNVAPTGSPPETRQASSVITAEPGGCAMFEDFRDLGQRGVSISLYDPATAQWYQTFVSSDGSRLVLAGGLVGGSMVLTQSDNATRITWSQASATDVRQLGESSRDGGQSWMPTFDLNYRPD